MIQCSEKGSDQDKMQSCALNAGDNLCTDSMKDFFEIGCNICLLYTSDAADEL